MGRQRFRMGDRWSNPLDQWPDPEVYIHYPSRQELAYVDIRNLNRTWPGRANGTLTEKTCYALTQLIKKEKVDIAIDLHEAELQYPVISTIVAHDKGQDLAAMASMMISGKRASTWEWRIPPRLCADCPIGKSVIIPTQSHFCSRRRSLSWTLLEAGRIRTCFSKEKTSLFKGRRARFAFRDDGRERMVHRCSCGKTLLDDAADPRDMEPRFSGAGDRCFQHPALHRCPGEGNRRLPAGSLPSFRRSSPLRIILFYSARSSFLNTSMSSRGRRPREHRRGQRSRTQRQGGIHETGPANKGSPDQLLIGSGGWGRLVGSGGWGRLVGGGWLGLRRRQLGTHYFIQLGLSTINQPIDTYKEDGRRNNQAQPPIEQQGNRSGAAFGQRL